MTLDRTRTRGRGRPRLSTQTKNRLVVGYCRVSTDKQDTSLTDQDERIRAYCHSTGRRLDEVVVDTASAKSLARPGLERVLDRMERGEIEAIVVVRLDRLTRSMRDLADILDLCAACECSLLSPSQAFDVKTPHGRMVINMMGVFAQLERELIGERTKSALHKLRRDGLVAGAVPYGFARDGHRLVAIPEEAEAVHRIKDLRLMDGLSYRRIADRLTEEGFKPRGKRWYASAVRSILKRHLTVGAINALQAA